MNNKRILFDEFQAIVRDMQDALAPDVWFEIGVDPRELDQFVVFKVDDIAAKTKAILGPQRPLTFDELKAGAFISLRLPYERMFIEWAINPYPLRLTREQIKSGKRPITGIAVMLWGWETPEKTYRIDGQVAYAHDSGLGGGGWYFTIFTDEQGQLESIKTDMKGKHKLLTDGSTAEGHLFYELYTALLTVALLHCKNVDTVENVRPYTPKMQRRGELPRVSVKTLKIRPVKRAAREGGEEHEGGTGSKRRLHLVRGHFKVFTQEAPLFGKYTGAYWWEAQARGDQERGVVIKQYEVESE